MPPVPVDLSRLLSQLNTTGLAREDNNLYQILKALIVTAQALTSATTGTSSGGGVIPDITALKQRTYWTQLDETANLPQSRQVIAGAGIVLDYSVANEVEVSASGSVLADYVVASDGTIPVPAPIDDGFGNFIYVPYTP